MNRLFKFAESYLESFDSAAAELRENTRGYDESEDDRGYSSYNPNLNEEIELPKGDHQIYVPRRTRSPSHVIGNVPKTIDKSEFIQNSITQNETTHNNNNDIKNENSDSIKQRSASQDNIDLHHDDNQVDSHFGTPPATTTIDPSVMFIRSSSPEDDSVGLHLSASIVYRDNDDSELSRKNSVRVGSPLVQTQKITIQSEEDVSNPRLSMLPSVYTNSISASIPLALPSTIPVTTIPITTIPVTTIPVTTTPVATIPITTTPVTTTPITTTSPISSSLNTNSSTMSPSLLTSNSNKLEVRNEQKTSHLSEDSISRDEQLVDAKNHIIIESEIDIHNVQESHKNSKPNEQYINSNSMSISNPISQQTLTSSIKADTNTLHPRVPTISLQSSTDIPTEFDVYSSSENDVTDQSDSISSTHLSIPSQYLESLKTFNQPNELPLKDANDIMNKTLMNTNHTIEQHNMNVEVSHNTNSTMNTVHEIKPIPSTLLSSAPSSIHEISFSDTIIEEAPTSPSVSININKGVNNTMKDTAATSNSTATSTSTTSATSNTSNTTTSNTSNASNASNTSNTATNNNNNTSKTTTNNNNSNVSPLQLPSSSLPKALLSTQLLGRLTPKTSLLGHITPSVSIEDPSKQSLQDEVNLLTSELSILKKKNLDLDIEMDTLETKLVYKDKQLAKAGTEIEALIKEKNDLYKQIDTMKKKYDDEMTQTTSIINLKEDYRLELEQSVKNYQADVYKLKSEIETNNSDIHQYKLEIENSKNEQANQIASLNQQIVYLQDQLNSKSRYILNQDELYNKKRQDFDQKINDLTRNISILEKQLESYKNNTIKQDDNSITELEGKLISLESELATEKQIINNMKKEKEDLLNIINQHKQDINDIKSHYEDSIQSLNMNISQHKLRISQLEKGETEQILLLSGQVEKLNQTISSQQLLLESVKSEKSSLEFRLAEQMREQARLRHTQKTKGYDLESNKYVGSLHVRKISRLCCQSNNILVQKIDILDDFWIHQFNNIVHIPIYRLIVISYMLFVTLLCLYFFFFK